MNSVADSSIRYCNHKWKAITRRAFGLLATTLTAVACVTSPIHAATSISASLGPVQRSIDVSDLEIFIETGDIPRSLRWYAARFTPEQLATLRQLLQQPIDVDALTIERITRLPAGETLLRRLLVLFNTTDPDSTYKALRSALVIAASREDGLTVANIIRSYPLSTIRINVDNVLAGVQQARELLIDDDAAIAYLKAIDTIQAEAPSRSTRTSIDPKPPEAISNPLETGPLAWIPSTITFNNPLRDNANLAAGLYLPQDPNRKAPLVVISHGVGSNGSTFEYLARHLASKGFAVATMEHPDTSSTRFEEYLAGFADPPSPELFYQRPADISALLDAIEKEPAFSQRVRTVNVGLIGQSLGGYTVLASAGAQLDFDHATEACEAFEGDLLPFNLSLLLQCSLLELPSNNTTIADDRIGAVLAINPVSSTVFGPRGMEQLDLPLLMVAGNDDLFAPAIPEQLYPFTWAGSDRKHLVMVEGATHFSFLSGFDEGFVQLPEAVIGPNPSLAHPVMNGLATAFFNTYINAQPEYSIFLDQPSVPENSPFNYYPTQSLSNRELSSALGRDS